MASINHTDENRALTGSKKRNFTAIEKSPEAVATDNCSKRLKLSENITRASNVEMGKKEKEVFEDKSESNDTLNTRTHSRRKLTAENLKTILRYVLANDSALAMVQNTLKVQKGNKCQLETETQAESTEPKAKEFQKTPWPILTPKKPDDVSKKLLEEEYSEESASDEDYQPNEEEFSDEDAASSVKADDLNSTKVEEYILPDLKPPDQPSDDEDALVIALPETICHDTEVDKIAQRTRSKLCLNDTPLETIESFFQPPDITMDMYDTCCDNRDWEEFLCEFTKPLTQTPGVGSVADDTEDEKDPEYKVQEEEDEEDEEEIDYDEICGENPLEVTGDEVNALMTEILEFAQQDKSLLEQDFSFLEELSVAFSGNENNSNDQGEEIADISGTEENKNNPEVENCSNDLKPVIDLKDSNEKENFNNSEEQEVTESHSEEKPDSTANISSSSILDPVENVRKEWMIPDERRQLDEQMRMYVQMLTQSYLLSHGFPSLNFINASSRLFLFELKVLANRGAHNNQRSAFYAHNLDDAVNIVTEFEKRAEVKQIKQKKLNKCIPDYIKKALASSKAFIYPELLPKFGFYTFYRGSKASFSLAEDTLIALGLDNFSFMENPAKSIQKFLLPTKSEYQIKCRIKNSKQKRESEHPIAYFCKHNKLAEINRVIRIFDPNNVKAPEEYPLSALPEWMESYHKETIQKREIVKQKSREIKPKLILPRIVPTFIQEFHPPHPQGASLPVVCEVYSLSENPSIGPSGLILPKRINRKRKKLAKNQVNKSTQYPEPPEVSSGFCISQSIKQEPQPQSEETSDEKYIEDENNLSSEYSVTSDEDYIADENNSDSSSENSVSLQGPVSKRNYSFRKGTVEKRNQSTNYESCPAESTISSNTQTFDPVIIKKEPLSSETSDEEHPENNAATHASHSETCNSRTVNNSSLTKHNQLQVEYSTLTEHSLRIVTSQGDESSDSDEDNPICSELLIPIQKFYSGVNEDAILPPASNSAQNHLPSDFSTIRDIITSKEKRKTPLNTKKTKVQTKKSKKSTKDWSREEDQLIISNCQKYGINKRGFRVSADEIGSIAPLKVKQRFIQLLKLLSEKLKNEE